jgi:DNA polymerase I-like protein with 3'-5' exonuclease and polymerase domains
LYDKFLVLDTETEAFAPAAGADPPRFVVGGFLGHGGFYETTTDIELARGAVQDALDQGFVVIGHNLAFDLAVLGVKLRRKHRVHDTMLADLLLRLARNDGDRDGKGLFFRDLATLYGKPMAGKGTTQTSFRPGVALTEEQLKYLEQDVRVTYEVARKQRHKGIPGGLEELTLQARAHAAMEAMTRQGLPVDLFECSIQKAAQERRRAAAARVLQKQGFYTPESRGPRGGLRKAKRSMAPFRAHVKEVAKAMGVPLRKTDTDQVATDKEFLLELQQDPYCKAWLEYTDSDKMIGTFLKTWAESNGLVHATFNVMVRTGRGSCRNPNLQNVPSRGKRGEVKKVFVAPKGRQLYELDYCQLELCTLAYLTQGRMKALINSGKDLHRELGVIYFDKPLDQVTKAERQLMKCANFGLPGGMGAEKFRSFIRTNGLPDPGEAAARDLINAWMEAYPEMHQWLKDNSGIDRRHQWVWAGKGYEYDVPQRVQNEAWDMAWGIVRARPEELKMPRKYWKQLYDRRGTRGLERWITGREVIVKGGRRRWPVTYTEQRNTRFQGLAANLAKDALASVTEELPHVWVHAFVHDSLLVSVTDAAHVEEVANKMLEASERWIPGIAVAVEACGPGNNWFEAKNAGELKFSMQLPNRQ